MTEPMTVERLEELRQIAAVHNSNMMDELICEVERLKAEGAYVTDMGAQAHVSCVGLKLRAEKAEAERDKYVYRYGCLSCGEVHDGMCPPHEVRTTGMAALRTPQALRAADAARKEKP